MGEAFGEHAPHDEGTGGNGSQTGIRPVGNGGDKADGRGLVLAVAAAGDGMLYIHPLPRRKLCDPISQRFHNAGAVKSGVERKNMVGPGIGSRPHQLVGPGYPGALHADEHLAGGGNGDRGIHHLKNFGSAVAVKHDRVHKIAPYITNCSHLTRDFPIAQPTSYRITSSPPDSSTVSTVSGAV